MRMATTSLTRKDVMRLVVKKQREGYHRFNPCQLVILGKLTPATLYSITGERFPVAGSTATNIAVLYLQISDRQGPLNDLLLLTDEAELTVAWQGSFDGR